MKTKHSSLFLFELIIAILFFCVCSAVCIRFFVKSHTLSQDTKNLTMAMNQTSMFAEQFRDKKDFLLDLQQQCPDGELSADKNTFTLFYTDSWTPCKREDRAFQLNIHLQTNSAFVMGSFTMTKIGVNEPIYAFTIDKYVNKGV